jgi:membrane protease YdiL (CAAX protease family)
MKMRTERALALMIGGLTAAIIARSTLIPSDWHFAFNAAIVALAIGVARLADLSTDELGLARRNVGAGLRLGGLAFVAITAVVALGMPFGLLDDDRTTVDLGDMALRVLVTIPIGTVVMEEFAFRGVLYGLLERVTRPTIATMVGAGLFGLWHVPPLLDEGAATVFGTLAATTVAGVGFIWLRRRSDSLLAPMLAHLATNSSTFALSWIVSR